MDYLWIKAAHVAAVVIWIAGMIAVALVLSALPASGTRTPEQTNLLMFIRGWDRKVTTPAILLVWGLGLALIVEGHWFPAPWLIVKLSVALLLGAVHGVLTGNLRRLAADASRSPSPLVRYCAPAILLGVLVIAPLVVLKPF